MYSRYLPKTAFAPPAPSASQASRKPQQSVEPSNHPQAQEAHLSAPAQSKPDHSDLLILLLLLLLMQEEDSSTMLTALALYFFT